jgi:group I intron endonuclease
MAHRWRQIHHSLLRSDLLKGGVYIVLNTKTGTMYVGSAKEFKNRWNKHTGGLLTKSHSNPILQRAWNKYKHDVFRWLVVEFVEEVKNLISREQAWLDWMTELGVELYNIKKVANSRLGLKCSDETKKRMSDAAKKRGDTFVRDDEWRKKVSEANKTNASIRCNKDMRNKMSKLKKGNKYGLGLMWTHDPQTNQNHRVLPTDPRLLSGELVLGRKKNE